MFKQGYGSGTYCKIIRLLRPANVLFVLVRVVLRFSTPPTLCTVISYVLMTLHITSPVLNGENSIN